jgi:hypothetical protein
VTTPDPFRHRERMAKKRDLNNSRPLELHRHSGHTVVRAWMDVFWDRYLAASFPENPSKRGPKAKSKPKPLFEVLFLDLYVAWLEDPDMCISFPRGENFYKVGSRYNKLSISKDIIKIADALLEQSFIDQKLGSESARKVTRIWPLEPLIAYFSAATFPEFLIDIHQHRECIVLRDNRKELEYQDKHVPFDIDQARSLLLEYNSLLRRTQIDISSLEHPVVVSEHYNKKLKRNETRRVSLRHDNKFVRRIFYRGDWTLGGRYHGGWWQQIPSKFRDQILINDQYTVEVDFSGFHISLAYGLEGHQPPDDPYALPVSIGGLSKEQQRKDVKDIALTALNAEDRKATFSAFRDKRNKEQRALPPSQKVKYTNALLDQLLDNFLKANAPISHYLCADKGVELMALDGQVTTEIIKHFTDRGVPILTVHDSYIVESAYEQELMDVMQSVTRKIVGNQKFKMKQEELSPNLIRSFVNQDKQINATDGYRTIASSIIRTPGYQNRYNAFQKYLEDFPL